MSKKRLETKLLLLNNLIFRNDITKERYKGQTVEGVLKGIVSEIRGE